MQFFSCGERTKPCLVILHGWGLSGEKYRELGKILSHDFFVVVPDMPGFGKTSAPEKVFSVLDYAKAVNIFLEEQNILHAVILGHSFGGRVAIKLALNAPEKLRALILSGTPGIEQFSVKRSLKRVVYYLAAKVLKVFSFVPPIRKVRDRFYEKRDYAKLEGVMKQTFLKVIREDLTRDVKQITQPMLLLWGSRDQMAPVMDAEKIMRLVPQSQLKIFAKVGHMFPYEKPHEFAREVVSFATNHHLL